MSKPLVLINFKVYAEASANRSLALAQKISLIKTRKYQLVIAPSLLTTREIAEKVRINVYAQHADVFLGSFTGSIPIQELKESGVQGIILNHSEKPISVSDIAERVTLARKYGLKTLVCASRLSALKRIAKLSPDYIAYEPKKLIGGTISVTEAKPKLIIKAVEAVKKRSKKTKLLCGAGIHNREDIRHALLLGAEGVLIGHAIPKSKDPVKLLTEMLR